MARDSRAVVWPTARQVFTRPVLFLAFGFGSGLSRKAPGTLGTLAAVPLYWLMQDLSLPVYLGIVIAGFLAGIPVCARAAAVTATDDHPGIVWDEIIGYLVTMTLAPAGWLPMLLGFGFFRLFDITKVFPVGLAERRLRGGLGIMADDLVAGVMAALGLAMVMAWLPPL